MAAVYVQYWLAADWLTFKAVHIIVEQCTGKNYHSHKPQTTRHCSCISVLLLELDLLTGS